VSFGVISWILLSLFTCLMTRRRFYAPPSAFSTDLNSVNLASDEARHLRDVLRLKPGDEVYVFDGNGSEFHCRIDESRRDSAQLRVISKVEPARPESSLDLTLAVALLKGEKFDLVVQKATELGVTRVVPVITRYADIRLRDESDAVKRVARWQRIALEAAKQSGRAVVPEVNNPTVFESLIQPHDAAAGMTRIIFSERGGQSLTEVAKHIPGEVSRATALVGSEGGWADEELAGARDGGWIVVTLGGRTLRAETAAITVVGLIQHLYGDLK
jgi:16S rRNA (uracil1498-N3)-methyltransferase